MRRAKALGFVGVPKVAMMRINVYASKFEVLCLVTMIMDSKGYMAISHGLLSHVIYLPSCSSNTLSGCMCTIGPFV